MFYTAHNPLHYAHVRVYLDGELVPCLSANTVEGWVEVWRKTPEGFVACTPWIYGEDGSCTRQLLPPERLYGVVTVQFGE